MTGITQIPLVRLFMPFLAGIIFSTYFDINLSYQLFFLIGNPLLIFSLLFKRHFQTYYNGRWVFGFTVYLFLFSAGNIITVNNNELKKPDHFSKHLEKEGYAILDIIEPVSERRNSYRIVCRVKNIIYDSIAYRVDGKAMLYLEKDSTASALNYGDRIITSNSFSPVSKPQNPYQFNYKRFLAFSNIHYQGYRAGGQYKVTASAKGNILKSKAFKIRQSAMQTLHKHNIQDKEFAVLSALLLGYREYIDDDLRSEFAGAGAMHILCVSGLHVGIMFLILNSLFSFFNKIKNGKIIKAIIIILLIWFYATLTGFSPSVLRASTMFSFVAIARSFNRYTNIYNILAASAIILTVADPYIVTKIGFQLSYLAVISIVTLQPFLYKLFYIKNKLSDKIWAIITVSVAAQIGTGPLAIYYFSQFPNYFIITNLIVIPLASIIIYTALLFLIISPIAFLAELLSKTLSFIVYLMHQSVHLIEALPYSTMQNVNLSMGEALIVLLLIILLTGFFIHKSRICFRLALPSIIVLAALFCLKNISAQKQNMFIVYSINNHTAIDFISGKKCTFVACQDLLTQGSSNIDFNIAQNRIRNEIKSVNTKLVGKDTTGFSKQYLWGANNYHLFKNLHIKILTDSKPYFINLNDSIQKLKLDYLIISQNPKLDIADLKRAYDFDKIIFDSSNPFWQVNQWLEECDELEINYWSTRHKGAYIRIF